MEQRIFQPFFQQTAPHSSLGEIQYIQQGIFLATIPEIARDFQIAQRIGIHYKILRRIQIGKLIQMRQIRHDRLMQIIQKSCHSLLRLKIIRPCCRIKVLHNAVFYILGDFRPHRIRTIRQA